MEVFLVDGDSPLDFTIDYGPKSKASYIRFLIFKDLSSGEYAHLQSCNVGDYVSYFDGSRDAFRALVIDLLPHNKVRILDIDEFTGIGYITDLIYIFKMTVDLIKFPPQYIKCCFLENMHEDIKLLWYQFNCDEIFVNFMKKHKIYLSRKTPIDGSFPPKYLVQLYGHDSLSGQDVDIWILEVILPELKCKLEQNNCNWTSMLSEKARDPFYWKSSIEENDIESTDCLSSTSGKDSFGELVHTKKFKKRMYLEIFVMYTSNLPPTIRIPFIRRTVSMEILKMASIKELYTSTAMIDPALRSIKQLMDNMNHPIAAKTHFNILDRVLNAKGVDGYLRADVKLLEQGSNRLKELYSDFCRCQYVNRKSLRQVSRRYLDLQFQALLVPYGINLSIAKENKTIDFLKRQIRGKLMAAQVISLNPPSDSKLMVKLYFEDGSCLENILTEFGFAY